MNGEDVTYPLPTRLLPYLNDLAATGMYGATIEKVVITLLEEAVRNKVAEGVIAARRYRRKAAE